MRVIHYKEEPFFILSADDVLNDLVRKRRVGEYSDNYLSFLKYNRFLIDKMKKKIGLNRNEKHEKTILLCMFLNGVLLDVLHDVFFKDKIAVFKNYKIAKKVIRVDEEFLKSKKEAHEYLKKLTFTQKQSIVFTKNDIEKRKNKFLNFERIFLSDIRDERLTVQLFFKKEGGKWKKKTARDT